MDEIRVRETEFVVSALPEDDGEQGWHYGEAFDIKVSYRGGDRWAVIHAGRCLSIRGTWEYESLPSNRADKWLREHRFDLPTALRLAREQAEKVTVNGHTALDVRARIAERYCAQCASHHLDGACPSNNNDEACCDESYVTVHGQGGQHQPWCVNK